MIKIIISLIVVLSIGLLIIKNKSEIGTDDACLCTEILVNESFINKKEKMPSVKKCISSFKNFENAHLECMKSIPLDQHEIKIDSLRSI
jgi:C4-dicarboxylate transporter